MTQQAAVPDEATVPVVNSSGIQCCTCGKADDLYIAVWGTDSCEPGTVFCGACSTSTFAALDRLHLCEKPLAEVYGPHEGCAEFVDGPEVQVVCGEPAAYSLRWKDPQIGAWDTVHICKDHEEDALRMVLQGPVEGAIVKQSVKQPTA